MTEIGKVIILPETTKNPITLMGKRAGVCWGGDISDDEKNYQRGLDCLKSNHGRVMEYVNIEVVLQGFSARVIREWYTHIGGAPSRLQSSTRYINYENFPYVIPPKIQHNQEALQIYKDLMSNISLAIQQLRNLGIDREDCGMVLPLCMETVVVDKRNLRSYYDMSHQRLCNRAYWEFRQMLNQLFKELSAYSSEWEYIIKTYMKPKCKYLGFCPEKKPCGKIF